jgi:D-glycero-D-manno-heptose 1,7-bisphosphate phosphatase
LFRYLRRELASLIDRPALFLDRDGVLNVRVVNGYVLDRRELEIRDIAISAAVDAQAAGAAIVVVTNQGAVGRGLLSESGLAGVNASLAERLEDRGLQLDAIYSCPHHPLSPDPGLRRCKCRKPAQGMFLQAAQDIGLDLGSSAMIGDQPSDIDAAVSAGIPAAHTLLVEDSMAPDDVRDAMARMHLWSTAGTVRR